MNDLEVPMRVRVERLEAQIAQLPQVHLSVEHHFAPGVYARKMTVPAGTIATGAVHKTEHLTIITGNCLLTTEDGVREFVGHAVIKSKAGIKRAITAIEDTHLVTIHVTDETDPDKLCELLTESKASELIGGADNHQALMNEPEKLL